MALGQVILRVFHFSTVRIGPLLPHTHLHLHVALTRGTNGTTLGFSKKMMLVRKSERTGQKSTNANLTLGQAVKAQRGK